MRNSAELRRFSSPHPSFFSEFLGSNEKGMAARAYIGREATDPVARWRGDRPPPPARDLFANSKKKVYIWVLSPVAWAKGPLSPPIGRPGGIFEIFQNGHIFLKF